MNRPALSLLVASTALLAACVMGEEDRREYLYKPAYCLAGGLAQLNSEQCLPKKLQEDAAAIAVNKLTTPQAPTVAKHVYFTEDQRLSMGYDIAEHFFTPYPKLTRSSVAVSLEANDIIAPETGSACGEKEIRRAIIDDVAARINATAINRETAKFLSEHYSDLQLSELYRVAKAKGDMATVPDDAFVMPDAKDAKKQVNIKPTTGRDMGSILSYTTSRTVSALIRKDRKTIETAAARITSAEQEKCAPKEPLATATEVPAEDAVAKAAKAVAADPAEKPRNDAAKAIAPAVKKEGVTP